jgi:hypothetical protein
MHVHALDLTNANIEKLHNIGDTRFPENQLVSPRCGIGFRENKSCDFAFPDNLFQHM